MASEAWKVLERFQTVGVAEVSLDGIVKRCNRKLATILGRDVVDVQGMHISEITANTDRLATERRLNALANGEVTETISRKQYRLPDGTTKWCSLESVVHDEENGEDVVLLSLIYEIEDSDRDDRMDALEQAFSEMMELTNGLSRGVTVNMTSNHGDDHHGDVVGGDKVGRNKSTIPGWVVAVVVLAIAAIAGVSIQSGWFSANTPVQVESEE